MNGSTPRYSSHSSGALAGSRCEICHVNVCPPRVAHCDRPMTLVELAPRGHVESFSDVQIAPVELRPPYRIAYVQLQSGPRVVARLEGELAAMVDPTGLEVQLAIAPVGMGESPALAGTLATMAMGAAT